MEHLGASSKSREQGLAAPRVMTAIAEGSLTPGRLGYRNCSIVVRTFPAAFIRT